MEWEKKFRQYQEEEEKGTLDAKALIREAQSQSFFAPLLIAAFNKWVEQETITPHVTDDLIPSYYLAGKIQEIDNGYFIVKGSQENEVRLEIASWMKWQDVNQDDLKRVLNDRGLFGMYHRLTIFAHSERDSGIVTYPHSRIMVTSDLRISFCPKKWTLAPNSMADPLDLWVLGTFLPDFLESEAKERAKFSRAAMEQWKRVIE